MMFTSVIQWKKHHPDAVCELHADKLTQEFFTQLGVIKLWDSVKDVGKNKAIDKNVFWASAKLQALRNVTEPVIIMDNDFIVYQSFDKFIKNEENFLNNSRYTGTEYSRVQANLEDNAEIETVLLNLNSFTYTPVIIDFTDPTNLIDAVGTKIDTFTYTEVPITKEYEAIRQSVTSQLNNPIKIINNKIEINKTYNLPIFITVKYQQEFKIKAGSLFSNTFELLNKNTKFDTNLYMDLTTETVANIGSQSSFNALKMVNYKANYTGTAIQELDKWIIGIAQSREYDIVGTITIYSDIIISPYTTVIELPLMRSGYLINEDDQNNITGFGKSISNDLPAIDIIKVHNGDNNQVLLKSEPIVSNGKFYNRIMVFMNNLNTSSEDLEFKIEMVKNIIIPRGEVKGSYSLALRNLIPSLSPLSPITAVGNYDPYVNGYLITVDEFLNEDPNGPCPDVSGRSPVIGADLRRRNDSSGEGGLLVEGKWLRSH